MRDEQRRQEEIRSQGQVVGGERIQKHLQQGLSDPNLRILPTNPGVSLKWMF